MPSDEHNELVAAAGKWLRKHYPIVFEETVTNAFQTPDAIGMNANDSTLIECKVSRSDFFADRKKKCHKTPAYGLGNYRWYLTLGSLVSVDELPLNWGLLEYNAGKIVRIWGAKWQVSNARDERTMLISALRRRLPVCAANRKKLHDEACLEAPRFPHDAIAC